MNKLMPYAKFYIGLAGAIITTILTTLPHAPTWLTILSSALTAAGVYLTPNSATLTSESPKPPTGSHVG